MAIYWRLIILKKLRSGDRELILYVRCMGDSVVRVGRHKMAAEIEPYKPIQRTSACGTPTKRRFCMYVAWRS